jgi:AcrR family transcriptional regulator
LRATPDTLPASDRNRDGRQGRAARSRLAICEACLDLVQEGMLQPSADQVAERAGVSRRSIFNHFADLAELYDAVVEVGMQRYAPLLEEIPEGGPVARRIDWLVRMRSSFLEATASFTRALTAQALVGTAADQALRVSQEGLRLQHREIETLFQPELSGSSASARAEVLEALSAATTPVLWEHLRRSRGNSIARARAIMRRTLTAILRDVDVDA